MVPTTSNAPGRARDRGETLGTRDRLLAEGARLFWTRGYAVTTTRQLSRLLGMQNASIYYHFEKKEDLLYAICVNAAQLVASALARCVGSYADPLEQLDAMIHGYVEVLLGERDQYATLLTELRSLSHERRDAVLRLLDANFAMLRQTIEAAQQRGGIRSDLSAKYLCLTLLNTLNWTIFWFHPEGELSASELADMFGSVFIHGVATPQGAPASRD